MNYTFVLMKRLWAVIIVSVPLHFAYAQTSFFENQRSFPRVALAIKVKEDTLKKTI